jgi:hypothetical protein
MESGLKMAVNLGKKVNSFLVGAGAVYLNIPSCLKFPTKLEA